MKKLTFESLIRVASFVIFSTLSSSSQMVDAGKVDSNIPKAGEIQPKTFDIVSIHEAKGDGMSSIDDPPNSSLYVAQHVRPMALLMYAYNIRTYDLVKDIPNWATTTYYDVVAKSDLSTDKALSELSKADSYNEKNRMLQRLLADRFKLKVHTEKRTSDVYQLSSTANAAKLLVPVHGDIAKTVSTCNPKSSRQGIEIESKGCPFSILTHLLSVTLRTKLVDNTGLSGIYAYHLRYSQSTSRVTEDEGRYPNLLDAVRGQLGLNLRVIKGDVDYLVVDHIERPTAN